MAGQVTLRRSRCLLTLGGQELSISARLPQNRPSVPQKRPTPVGQFESHYGVTSREAWESGRLRASYCPGSPRKGPMRRLVARLSFAVLLAGPISAQARSHLKTHSLTRRRLFGCGRSRSRTRVLWPRCPRARPSGSTHAPKAGAASRFQSSPATCSRSSSARKRRKPRRHRDAAISTHRGNRSHRPHGQPIANRPGGLRPTAGTGRSASAARGRGRARIMAGWRSG